MAFWNSKKDIENDFKECCELSSGSGTTKKYLLPNLKSKKEKEAEAEVEIPTPKLSWDRFSYIEDSVKNHNLTTRSKDSCSYDDETIRAKTAQAWAQPVTNDYASRGRGALLNRTLDNVLSQIGASKFINSNIEEAISSGDLYSNDGDDEDADVGMIDAFRRVNPKEDEATIKSNATAQIEVKSDIKSDEFSKKRGNCETADSKYIPPFKRSVKSNVESLNKSNFVNARAKSSELEHFKKPEPQFGQTLYIPPHRKNLEPMKSKTPEVDLFSSSTSSGIMSHSESNRLTCDNVIEVDKDNNKVDEDKDTGVTPVFSLFRKDSTKKLKPLEKVCHRNVLMMKFLQNNQKQENACDRIEDSRVNNVNSDVKAQRERGNNSKARSGSKSKAGGSRTESSDEKKKPSCSKYETHFNHADLVNRLSAFENQQQAKPKSSLFGCNSNEECTSDSIINGYSSEEAPELNFDENEDYSSGFSSAENTYDTNSEPGKLKLVTVIDDEIDVCSSNLYNQDYRYLPRNFDSRSESKNHGEKYTCADYHSPPKPSNSENQNEFTLNEKEFPSLP